MRSKSLRAIYAVVNSWWASLVIGILSLSLGVAFIIQPQSNLFSLVNFFILGFFIIGIIEIFFAVDKRNFIVSWSWLVFLALLCILFSLSSLSSSTETVSIFIVIISSFVLIFYGIFRVCLSIKIKSRNNRKNNPYT